MACRRRQPLPSQHTSIRLDRRLSKQQRQLEYTDIAMDVLRALEKAALKIKPEEIKEISRWESWDVGRNV